MIEVAPIYVHRCQLKLYFLPHRAVIRLDKITTSIGMVYDARMISIKGGLLLNDVLEKGLLLTPLMYMVLLRFRCKNIIVNADIEKAFLQIEIHVDGRDMLKFLWVDGIEEIDIEHMENNKIVEFRICCVLFGLKPSPHLSSAAVRKHISTYYSVEFSVEKIFNSLHVDDILTSVQSDEEGIKFYNFIKTCLSAASLTLENLVLIQKLQKAWYIQSIQRTMCFQR